MIVVYFALMTATVANHSSYAAMLNNQGIGHFIMIFKLLVWACQLFSFFFLLLSTCKIRNLTIKYSEIRQVANNKTIIFMLVLVTLILIFYFTLYAIISF
jgi:hypothetical protein